ncbi:hypothetical protein HDF19_13275 [Mucilaginibacter sp. E4BP6]|uniref:hypothetical protein n=1 Tax=Mucilaginibacter sp. E4BP6 TaxID=2723089 RepID=UPI0015C7DF1B|nr:hypothetical protein [Mucilaginibacter sp. E4BP6]NYE66049.1 hypothetical protein [Mucilaginibacter sp. E4BP6]
MKLRRYLFFYCSLFLINTSLSLAQNNIVTVNQATGAANVTIPLYTLNAAHVSLPISLSYSATGLRIDDVEGTAGVGWNLVVGGATTANRYVALQTTEYNVVHGGNIVLQPAAGSVTIGTSNIPPGFMLAINGSGIATSFTVQSYANWPDYVFNTDYKLRSLDQVKTYIDQNHHLPDIPSADQVAKDGINLGEIDNVFTKKIEERTLYLIDKDSQVKDLQEKIKLREERIRKLEDETAQLIQSTKKVQ